MGKLHFASCVVVFDAMAEKPIWIPPKHGQVPKPVTTESGNIRYDVSYALISGFRPLELQLFLPQATEPAPLIVWIHGGGYAGGTRVEGTPWFEATNYRERALAQGFAFASIDYRLGKEESFPAAVNDAHASLRWLAKYADQLNLDVARTILWGESAGGHLAALTAYTVGHEYFEGSAGAEKSAQLKILGLVDWYGATDLNSIIRPMDGTDESMPEEFRYPPEYYNLGPERWKDHDWLAKASPINYVSPNSPTTLMVHGDVDTMVPLQQSQILSEKLTVQGVRHQLEVIPGGDHGWMGLPADKVSEIVARSLEFMKSLV